MRSTKYGGIEHYIVETARQSNEYGYKTVVQYEECPESTTYCNELKALGVKVVILRSNINLLQDARQITKLIRTVRPTVIQTYFPSRSTRLLTPIIARMLGVHKTIATVLSMYHFSKTSLIARFSYNRYDKVMCISNAIAKNLLDAGVNPHSISSLYMGVFGHVQYSEELRYQLRSELQIPKQNKVFACIAFDVCFKGLDVLLRSFEKVSEDRSDINLIIVGVDPEQSQLPGLAETLGISERVHWAGIRDEGWRVLSASDIYVQSSRSAEGLSIATIEAMALKLPVVATRVAGPAEIVLHEETGYLCEPDNVESLAEVMRSILDQPEKWKKMGEAGYQRYVEMLRGEKSVEKLIQSYYLS